MKWLIPVLVVACSSCSACSNKLEGSVEVNSEQLTFDACRNGAVYGFRGVELSATNGMRLRLGMLPTGAPGVVVMPKGADVGKDLNVACGSLTVTDQKTTINGVKNVEGRATLACEGEGYKIKGEVNFENCH